MSVEEAGIAELAKQLKLRQRVAASAMVYFRRTYLCNDFCRMDPRLVYVACLYLACKAEESLLAAKHLVVHAKTLRPKWAFDVKDLLDMEMVLLEDLDFNLIVFSPYRDLATFLADAGLEQSCAQRAWGALNDSYRTDVHLLHPPHIVALGCLCLAASSDGVELGSWLQRLNVELGQVPMLPRPASAKTQPAATSWALFFSGPHFRRWAVVYHLAIIARDVWKTYTAPGTFRAFCKAVASWASGKGFVFELPAIAADDAIADVGATKSTRDADNWYITQKDLAFYQYHMEQNGDCPGASPWEVLMEKDIPNCMKYTAWRRTLANGKTEYKSLTHSADATAEEFTDLYFDDDYRPKWDAMIIHHEVVEHGDFSQRQQVVRWVRRFPFKFLSDREYTIARRLYRTDDCLYGLTKVVDHPSARRDSHVVKMDVFYSMWRSRTVQCPWGSNRPACETLLLHHEQFKIMEHLARFAVRHGMWGFVKTLSERTPEYIARRRQRGLVPTQIDAMAYGYNGCPGPAPGCVGSPGGGSVGHMQMSQSSLSLCSLESSSLGGAGGSLSRQGSAGLPRGKSVPSRVKGLLAVAMASGLAVLMKRSNSMPSNLNNVKALKSRRQQLRRQTSMTF
ncbi:CYCC1 protein [Gonium pectorale]|uniref:CYCC1 protein n=1 Tax=Gonium pectorale TaxID=33097 RepID=A0A150H2Z3_GONPE|nr:CYCC1 protein [Gonium pectorale]|eukprot:KXZ56547.1 CYCC1 protein [Gonium pectorale]